MLKEKNKLFFVTIVQRSERKKKERKSIEKSEGVDFGTTLDGLSASQSPCCQQRSAASAIIDQLNPPLQKCNKKKNNNNKHFYEHTLIHLHMVYWKKNLTTD